uniref:SCP domain-containing protein n=1 Tax=Anas platyrhynchos TaxID=8839 RepID=A0A8B9QUI6_ANAPL
MMSRFFTCMLALLRFCLSAGSSTPQTLPDIGDAEFIEQCVTEHNKFRSAVSPPASDMLYMTWDPDLAKTAKAWAKRCQFKHNTYLKEPGQTHPRLYLCWRKHLDWLALDIFCERKPSPPGTMRSKTTVIPPIVVEECAAITHRLFGLEATRLAVLSTSVPRCSTSQEKMRHSSSATTGRRGIMAGTPTRREQHAANARAISVPRTCVETQSVTKSLVIPSGIQPGTDLPVMSTAFLWLF